MTTTEKCQVQWAWVDLTQVDCHTSAALRLEWKRRKLFEVSLGLVYDLVFSILLVKLALSSLLERYHNGHKFKHYVITSFFPQIGVTPLLEFLKPEECSWENAIHFLHVT